MDVFKTEVGKEESILITEENYKKATKGYDKYWRKENNNRKKYYAVCPLCDNPIQIIGLYKAHEDGKNPYGRHNKGDIPNIAKYDEDAYLACPYSNPNRPKSKIRRTAKSKSGIELLNVLRTQFDRIVYIWDRTTGIKMSNALAEELLRGYIKDEGWLYYDSNKYNLPFMLIYADHRYPLIGRFIYKDSKIYQQLSKLQSIHFEEAKNSTRYVKIVRNEMKYLDLAFYLTKHKPQITYDHPKETFEVVIVENNKIIIEQTVEVDIQFSKMLMNLSDDSTYRNKKLLEIAKATIPI